MIVATCENWILETAVTASGHNAWVSDPDRQVVGFGRAKDLADAAAAAINDAFNHDPSHQRVISCLSAEYFGSIDDRETVALGDEHYYRPPGAADR